MTSSDDLPLSKNRGLKGGPTEHPRSGSLGPLLVGLLVLGGLLAYGAARTSRAPQPAAATVDAPATAALAPAARESPPGADARNELPRMNPAGAAARREAAPKTTPKTTLETTPETKINAAPSEPSAAPPPGGLRSDSKAPAPGAAPAPAQSATAIVKMDPLVANLDDGDQLRYLRVSLQIEVLGDAKDRVQAALPRARHEALMYLSGLHLGDTQGLLGKQRIHRELQRRIADAVGGGVKRIYFDEFFVQ